MYNLSEFDGWSTRFLSFIGMSESRFYELEMKYLPGDEMDKLYIESYLNALPDDIESLNISDHGFKYIPDLSRFTKLEILYCNDNQLTSLPTLPENLKELCCSNNQLTSLPALPQNLETLNCNNNSLNSLPILPENLETLYCYKNQLTSLPALPKNLEDLMCSNNQLTSLPNLPQNLKFLMCNNNQLTSLPDLPQNLKSLCCNNNQLTLPVLPKNLDHLDCDDNQLNSLLVSPEDFEKFRQKFTQPNFGKVCTFTLRKNADLLPDKSINFVFPPIASFCSSTPILSCNNNQLTSLPALPENMEHVKV
jgi:Leucine-rich repeat (LRR) protein